MLDSGRPDGQRLVEVKGQGVGYEVNDVVDRRERRSNDHWRRPLTLEPLTWELFYERGPTNISIHGNRINSNSIKWDSIKIGKNFEKWDVGIRKGFE